MRGRVHVSVCHSLLNALLGMSFPFMSASQCFFMYSPQQNMLGLSTVLADAVKMALVRTLVIVLMLLLPA